MKLQRMALGITQQDLADMSEIAISTIKRGVDKSQIKAYNLGGIDKYAANEANRFTTVVLLK
jgi:transcriptional regulator with XRE-family HTH domain